MFVYTTLTQFKMAMNDGALPPMTPIPESIQQYIDPALTIGMGALTEDQDKGLRCPVRGCGEWSHHLTRHLNRYHAAIGGAVAIRKLLQIPETVALLSQRARLRHSTGQSTKDYVRQGSLAPRRIWTPSQRRQAQRNKKATQNSMATRNLANACDAQLSHRLIDLEHELGHSPSIREAETKYGRQFTNWVQRIYGSWNSAKAQWGMKVQISGYAKEDIVVALAEFHRIHHRLPRIQETQTPDLLPKLPSAATIMKALCVTCWADAMYAVAGELGVEYEIPPKGRRERTAA